MMNRPQEITVAHKDRISKGTITLGGSKSISNRVLLIRALCDTPFNIHNLSDSDDTTTLLQLLESDKIELDAHHAGTTFRFMTSYLAFREGSNVLTGSARMQERPIGPLVEALNTLGADISYLQKEGYPPLYIADSTHSPIGKLILPAGISSQYISSLLMIAPTLPNGLEITLEGNLVSKPYIDMTLSIMEYFGVNHTWEADTITVRPQNYIGKDYHVESDWSAASYYYIIAALSNEADITLVGLHQDSMQGDKVISEIAQSFGVTSSFGERQVRLTKTNNPISEYFEYDFTKCPDIAQSVSTMAAGLGVTVLFSGLQTLRVKETDRIAALQAELAKLNVFLTKLPQKFSKDASREYFLQEGEVIDNHNLPTIETYNDHRMAMSFAPLSLIHPLKIKDPNVVSKSYPSFWKDLESLGFVNDWL